MSKKENKSTENIQLFEGALSLSRKHPELAAQEIVRLNRILDNTEHWQVITEIIFGATLLIIGAIFIWVTTWISTF